MIILDATTKSLQIILGGAVTTNELVYTAGYADLSSAGTTLAETDGLTTGGTAVTAVSAPSSGTVRKVLFLNVQNNDTVSAVVTVRINNNGTFRKLISATLAAGSTLVVNNDGWKVIDTSGQLVVTAVEGVPTARNIISGGGLTGGGDLSADRTLAVGAGTGITVNTDDVAVNQAALKLDDWAAPDDNTDLNASTSAHGLMPKGGNDTTKFYRGDTTQAVPDHGSIGGLADDDHTQYALLAGRSSGQTLKGGTGASENLTLSSTNHATKGAVTLADEILSRAELRDHMESKATGSISSNTLAVDYTNAAVFAVSLGANITTFTISNPAPSGTHCAVTFVFTADGTVRSITWPSGTVWPGGSGPTMTGTNGKRDIITLITFDGGTTWFGIVVGQNY